MTNRELFVNDSLCVGLLQSTILESVGCIWFNRSEAKDREIVARKYVEYNEPKLFILVYVCINFLICVDVGLRFSG